MREHVDAFIQAVGIVSMIGIVICLFMLVC